MQDRQLYQQILGITSPWFVERVELNLESGEVNVHLSHPTNASWQCAECGRECPLYDHQPVRTWRHLDTCQYRTLMHAASLGRSALNTVCAWCGSRGPSREAISRCCSNVWRSTGCRKPVSKRWPGSSIFPGMKSMPSWSGPCDEGWHVERPMICPIWASTKRRFCGDISMSRSS